MNFNISENLKQVHFPPISEVKGWLAGRSFPAERPLIDLCQAIPDYAPPAELTRHLQYSLEEAPIYKYSQDDGLPEVREEISAWYRRRYGAGPKPSELCLTIGASQAFWLAMGVLCQAGDEVILQLPAYFDHPMGLQAMGVRPVFAPFEPATGGLPELTTLEALITERTRAILLVTPSNPTGAMLPPEQLQQLLELCRRQQIALVLDETYNAFIDGAPHRLFAEPAWGQNFVHLASFGKTFALTGLRAGALAASQAFIHQALKLQDSMAVCQPQLTQRAVAYGCRHLDAWVDKNARMMQRRHDRFCQSFQSIGNPFRLDASGGFFAWVRHPWPQLTGRQAAKRLADRANLSCLPGEVFGPGLERYLRLAFGNLREEQIPAAVERFRQVQEGVD